MSDHLEVSGIEKLKGIAAGELAKPPMWELIGLSLVAVKDGEATFVCTPKQAHLNPWGVAHGGLAATLLDSAVGCSIQTLLPAGVSYTTLELKINYIRPMTPEMGEVRAIGTAVHVGRRSAVAEGQIIDKNGKLIARASTTCMVFRPD